MSAIPPYAIPALLAGAAIGWRLAGGNRRGTYLFATLGWAGVIVLALLAGLT